MTTKKKVLVTGFGPFGSHKINASWVSVQRLKELGISDDVDLIIEEIPVDYNKVKVIIPQLWEKEKPDLVVHVGVSGIAGEITLEQQAHNDGYDRLDVNGTCPSDCMCIQGAETCSVSDLDMTKVCKDINSKGVDIKAVVSMDPGRYLCDFSYNISLNINKACSAFIHVPPLNAPYSADQLAEGIQMAIISMLNQIS